MIYKTFRYWIGNGFILIIFEHLDAIPSQIVRLCSPTLRKVWLGATDPIQYLSILYFYMSTYTFSQKYIHWILAKNLETKQHDPRKLNWR